MAVTAQAPGLGVGKLELLRIALRQHRYLKTREFLHNHVPSKIAGFAGYTFSINNRLEVFLPEPDKIPRSVHDLDAFVQGGLAHEDAHVFLTPFIRRSALVLAVAKWYTEKAGIPFNPRLFSKVEGVVSDVVNEVVLLTWGTKGEYRPWKSILELNAALYEAQGGGDRVPDRRKLESDPLRALLALHFSNSYRLYKGEAKWYDGPGWFTDHVYKAIYNTAGEIEPDTYAMQFLPSLLRLHKVLVVESFVSLVKELYGRLAEYVRAPSTRMSWPIQDYYDNPLVIYYAVLLATYTLYAKDNIEPPRIAVVSLRDYSQMVNSDELDGIIEFILNASRYILPPGLLRRAAERLLRRTLVFEDYQDAAVMGGESRVPWVTGHAGKPIISTMLTENPLEWRVRARSYAMRRSKGRLTGSPPEHVYVILDESGSTIMMETDLLAPLVSTPTTVYDAERAVAVSMLTLLSRMFPGTPAVYLGFSDGVEVREGSARRVADYIAERVTPMGSGTNILAALEVVMQRTRRPGPRDVFIVLTDASLSELEEARRYMAWIARRSPLLAVSMLDDWPDTIASLDGGRVGVVTVRGMGDLPALEHVMRRVTRAALV